METAERLKELQIRKTEAINGGGEDKLKKQREGGRKTARERILALLDEGSFTEVGALVKGSDKNYKIPKSDAACDGVVTGYGTVDGRTVFVYSQDHTVIGGSVGEMHAKKISKIYDMAAKMGSPVVAFIDSDGARIEDGVSALAGYGEIFLKNSRLSGVIPQIAAVFGNCAGGAACTPAMSDFTVMVDKTSKMYMASSAVIAGVTGEKENAAEFGTAAALAKTGDAQITAASEDEAIAKIRELLSYVPSNNLEDAPLAESVVAAELCENIASGEFEDVKTVITDIADGGRLFEISPEFAKNIVVGFIRLNGMSVGVVANQKAVDGGLLDIDAADKASRFIRFCDCYNIPVVTIADIEGYKISASQQNGGIARHCAKLIYAYAEATTPKITVIAGKAYTSAAVSMGSKELGTDLVYAWATAEIGVLQPDAAATLIYADELEKTDRAQLIEKYRNELANPVEVAKTGYADDVIEPAETRKILISALEMLSSKRDSGPARKHGNMPL